MLLEWKDMEWNGMEWKHNTGTLGAFICLRIILRILTHNRLTNEAEFNPSF